MIKIKELRLPAEFEQGGFAWAYVPDRKTLYITGDAYHYGLVGAASIDPHYPYYLGDVDGQDPGINFYSHTAFYPTPKEEAELTRLLEPYVNMDNSFLTRWSNIYDPIEEELDKHAFRNGEPRQSVVNFIKRLYSRALKQEYGIDNAELFIDLYITGSLTTYQYSETSDCDVSVFPNYQRFADAFGEDSSKTRKRLVSLSIEHIDGTFLPGTTHPLQFFVVADGIERQDLYQPGLRSAWSIYDEMWVVPPERERSHNVATEFPDAYSRASSMASKMADALDHDPESARELWKLVHQKRQLDQMAGLGDYSEGNIVYKWLLHEGLFDRIRNELGEYIAKTSTDINSENAAGTDKPVKVPSNV